MQAILIPASYPSMLHAIEITSFVTNNIRKKFTGHHNQRNVERDLSKEEALNSEGLVLQFVPHHLITLARDSHGRVLLVPERY